MMDMQERAIRLYLDTNIISAIDAPHKPQAEALTKRFFSYVAEHGDEYELYTSPMVTLEVGNCPEPKRTLMRDFLECLPHTKLQESSEVKSLVNLYINAGVLGAQHARDLTHLAYAVVSRCDFIVSWNFEHVVNAKTLRRIKSVNEANNHSAIMIVPPFYIIGEHYDGESK